METEFDTIFNHEEFILPEQLNISRKGFLIDFTIDDIPDEEEELNF